MKRLTNQTERELAARAIESLLRERGEWFCAEGGARTPVGLRPGEWEIVIGGSSLQFAFLSGAGWRAWRVAAWEWAGGRLRLKAARRAGAERTTLELVPRASARESVAVLFAARLAASERLAQTACSCLPGGRIERVRLSGGARRSEPGRYARVLLARGNSRVAVTGPVVALRARDAEAFVASALLWWARLGARAPSGGRRLSELWLVTERELIGPVGHRLALLREAARHDIRLFEADGGGECLSPALTPGLAELLDAAPTFRGTFTQTPGEAARRIIALAPDAIDSIRARHGETLRYHGLPFARIRHVSGCERVWFGLPGAAGGGRAFAARRLLDESNWDQLAKLLDELAAHRRAAAPDARHALYRAAPESWLESLLRRDVTRLDPGLVVSPLHAQFRAAREASGGGSRPVDLLALRRDGRLVLIELKVAEDAALALQGADYWRRVESHRRAGHLAAARLFGGREIADEPPLVYLAAPVFRFHRRFDDLARLISPDIETYRFDLNEDWRAGVRVVRRTRFN
ncbi:MAG: hypothetical protein ACRD9R_23700 [Pyrinomonadaceae bacterium]